MIYITNFLRGVMHKNFVDDRVGDFDECIFGSESALSEMMDALYAAPENFYISAAQIGKIIVGFIYGVFRGTNVQSGWVVVSPDCRCVGVAARLHDVMIDSLSDLGVEEVSQVAATDLGEDFLYRQGYESVGGRNFMLAI